MNKVIRYYVVGILILFCVFIGSGVYIFRQMPEYKNYINENGICYTAKVDGKRFLIYDEKKQWKEIFLTGVNIGVAKPGHFPGEVSITEQEYSQWFQMIADMNCSVIRVYIPQTPEFYQALYRYNQVADQALYLVQGVYINEQKLEADKNILEETSEVKQEFFQDIKDSVDMIHGNATIEKQVGKAYGTYTSDVSKYVIGWILGIEFSAEDVAKTNEVNRRRAEYEGEYVYTKGASPFESFLAQAMDVAIKYETDGYHMQRPVAICNWVTTDPLEHPNEPDKKTEDAEVIDVEHILAKETFEPGFFASYHVYPYYPESMMYDTKYQVEGSSTYREYLKELNDYHSIPVLISEFGIPTSRGITHIDADRGFNQGNMSERQQGEALSTMIEDIYSSGCMGGFVFSWQDEWFKRSWNTMDYDDPSRRPFWHDLQTSEQNFGLITFESLDRVNIDGLTTEWEEKDLVAQTDTEKLYAKYDFSYIYLLAKVADFENMRYIIPIDTITNQGNQGYLNQSFSKSADFIIVLSGSNNSKMLVDPYYNPNFKQYGELFYSKEDMAYYNVKDSNQFIPITQVLNRELYLPETKQVIPFEEFDTGKLTYGITDPEHEEYNSLADFYVRDNQVEIRIPWLLLNVADPSSKKIISNLQENETITFQDVEGIYLGIGNQKAEQTIDMNYFTWEEWSQTQYVTRAKKSYYMLQESFATYRNGIADDNKYLQGFKQARIYYVSIIDKVMHLPILVYVCILFGSIMLYLICYLFIMNAQNKLRDKKRWIEQEKVLSYIKGLVDTSDKINKKYLRSIDGLSMLDRLVDDLNEQEKQKVHRLFEQMGYKKYINKNITSSKPDTAIQIIRLLGAINYGEYAKEIVACMYKNSNNVDVQYNGLLALARMNCSDAFISICLDDNYKKIITYRCLSEIAQIFQENKKELCIRFLTASDFYIQRIAIQLIGKYQYMDFEDQLIEFLNHKNMNVRCDTIRTLGELGSKKSVNYLIEMIGTQAWQEKNIIYCTLAKIGLEDYQHVIKNGLYSPEWWVRYNAANLLVASFELSEIYQEVMQGTDQFAKEALQFAVAKRELQRGVRNDKTFFADIYKIL